MGILVKGEITITKGFKTWKEMVYAQDGKLKELENIVFEIERLKDTIDWAHSTIQSCLFNLEGGKGLKESDVKMFAVDIRENLNKKEKAPPP